MTGIAFVAIFTTIFSMFGLLYPKLKGDFTLYMLSNLFVFLGLRIAFNDVHNLDVERVERVKNPA